MLRLCDLIEKCQVWNWTNMKIALFDFSYQHHRHWYELQSKNIDKHVSEYNIASVVGVYAMAQ